MQNEEVKVAGSDSTLLQPPALTTSVYVPATVTVICCVVAPLDQRYVNPEGPVSVAEIVVQLEVVTVGLLTTLIVAVTGVWIILSQEPILMDAK